MAIENGIEEVTPVTAPVSEDVGESDSFGADWGKIDEDFDRDLYEDDAFNETPVSEEVPSTPPEGEVATPPPAEPPAAATPEPVQPPQPPVEEAPAQPQPEWQPPQLPPAEQVEAVRQQYMQQLAETYKLDEATAELVDTNFSAVAPQLLSQVHMRVAESVTQTLGQMLPQLISSQLQYMQVAKQSTDKFFSQWPELNRPEYQNTIGQVAQLYRQLKPQASADDFVREVGIQAWTALGLPVQQLLTRGQQQQPQAAPVPQMQETFPQGGYAPATPGAPARSQLPPSGRPTNVFEQFAEEFLNDEY